jgi:phosphatidylglycerophosphatase B
MFDFSLTKKVAGLKVLALFGTLLLIVTFSFPVIIFTGPVNHWVGFSYHWLSESAGKQLFLFTIALLCLLPLWLRCSRKEALQLWVQFAVILLLSFAIKTGLKQVTEVPRPYVSQLHQLALVDSVSDFYQLDNVSKQSTVDSAEGRVTEWRLMSWRDETNYSMPSGHTIFAAVCIVFWGGFLFSRKRYLSTSLLIIWGVGVGYSRIWIGMHWPQDLVVSMISAGFLYCMLPNWSRNKRDC